MFTKFNPVHCTCLAPSPTFVNALTLWNCRCLAPSPTFVNALTLWHCRCLAPSPTFVNALTLWHCRCLAPSPTFVNALTLWHCRCLAPSPTFVNALTLWHCRCLSPASAGMCTHTCTLSCTLPCVCIFPFCCRFFAPIPTSPTWWCGTTTWRRTWPMAHPLMWNWWPANCDRTPTCCQTVLPPPPTNVASYSTVAMTTSLCRSLTSSGISFGCVWQCWCCVGPLHPTSARTSFRREPTNGSDLWADHLYFPVLSKCQLLSC